MIADSTSVHFPLLSLLLWLPVAGAVVCLVSYRKPGMSRWLALGTALIVLAASFVALAYSGDGGSWFLYEDADWIEPFGIRYTLGMDGISLLLVILTAFLQVVAVLVSWNQDKYRAVFFRFDAGS